MSITDKQKYEAESLLNSTRGRLVISQALKIALKELTKIEDKTQEKNIADMELLRDVFFSVYPDEQVK